MGTDRQAFAGDAGSAALPKPAASARRPEGRITGVGDAPTQSRGACRGALSVVDSEVIDGEAAGNRRAGGRRFDPIDVAGIDQRRPQILGAVRRIGEDRDRLWTPGPAA